MARYALILKLPFDVVVVYKNTFKTLFGARRKKTIDNYKSFEVVLDDEIPSGAITIPFSRNKSGAKKNASNIRE